MKTTQEWAGVVALATAVLFAGSAFAAQVGKGKAKDDDNPGGGGAQAAVDAQGKLRAPTAEESAALLQQMARYVDQSSVGLTVKTLPNGTRVVDLQDRFQDVALARVVDGKVEFACVDSLKEAKAFLEGKAAAHPSAPVSRAPQRVTTPLEEK
jgi:hypothetical protein